MSGNGGDRYAVGHQDGADGQQDGRCGQTKAVPMDEPKAVTPSITTSRPHARQSEHSVPESLVRAMLALVGAVPGVALSLLPLLLFRTYVRSFVATATPDSGFNILTVPAVICVLLAAVFLGLALIMLFFRAVRIVGIGYLVGIACGIIVGLLLDG